MLRTSLAFSLLLASQLLSAAPQMHALPVLTGIDVGAISISAAGAVVEINTLETAGNTTLTNWNGFNIGETASSAFVRDPSSSLTLNRSGNSGNSTLVIQTNSPASSYVLSSSNRTQTQDLQGDISLDSGRVLITNSSGLSFGGNARVNVNSLTTTGLTNNLSDSSNGTLRISGNNISIGGSITLSSGRTGTNNSGMELDLTGVVVSSLDATAALSGFGGNSTHANVTIVQSAVPLPAAFYLFLTALVYLIRFSSKNNYSGN